MASDPSLASQLLAMRKVKQDSSSLSDEDVSSTKLGNMSARTSMTKQIGSSYRDFSRVMPEKHNDASSLIAQSTTAKEPTFPVKLHMILSNPEFQDIIAWLPHGRSWRILQQKAFEERVIPLYFRHGRYSSFARQVNGWGFRRITHGSDYNSYFHELFLRGMPHLCDKMRRLTTKDLGKRKKTDDGPTPDFYALSRENPLPESTPVPTTTLTPPAIVSANAAACRPNGDLVHADVELALLERRRADIFNRMNLLAGSNNVSASFGGQGQLGLGQSQMMNMNMNNMMMNPMGNSIGQSQLSQLSQFGGQQDLSMPMPMNNNSLMAAAALSLGNAGRQPNIMGGMPGMPNVGNILDASNTALQRQLLEARLVNSDMAAILGLNNNNATAPSNGANGIPGFMMPPL